jgi:hypothetical protein
MLAWLKVYPSGISSGHLLELDGAGFRNSSILTLTLPATLDDKLPVPALPQRKKDRQAA